MAKITKIKKSKNKKIYLTLGLLTAIFSLAGAFSLSVAWADWVYPTTGPTEGEFPPGPVWLQDSTIENQQGGIYLGDSTTETCTNCDIQVIGQAAFGGNNLDVTSGETYKLSTPDAVFKDGASGTTIRDGVITTDSNLEIKGGIGVWDTTTDPDEYNFGTDGQILSSIGCSGDPEVCGLDWISASAISGEILPEGSDGQTLRYNGSAWVANSALTNDGTDIAVSGDINILGDASITGSVLDSLGDAGTSGQVLSSTSTGTNWITPTSGSSGYIVGSVGPGDGSQGGWSDDTGVNNFCDTAVSGSHLCSTNEVLRTISRGDDLLEYSGNYYWVSGGVDFPAVDIDIADCEGWTSNSADSGGVVWYLGTRDDQHRTYVSFCSDSTNYFLCCQ